jgi:glycosyltransferase involved in cell wall biosynthesis
VVYSLQDEDVWVDAMAPSWREIIWQLMREKSLDVDAFIAVSDFFAGIMKDKMGIPDEKMHVVHIGVRPENYSFSQPAHSPPAIGYLSRICEENGFEILIDAFIRLKADPRFDKLKLKVTGGMTNDDKPFLHRQLKKLTDYKIQHDIEIIHDFNLKSLQAFFSSITVLSVPVLHGEAYGLYQIEAMASGVPLVQPALGAFPEIIELSGGGVLYSPNNPDALASKLAQVLSDPVALEQMSRLGRKSVEEKFDCRKLTNQMVEVYTRVIS